MGQMFDDMTYLCQMQQDLIARYERQLNDIRVEVREELRRIERHDGEETGFALRIQALLDRQP